MSTMSSCVVQSLVVSQQKSDYAAAYMHLTGLTTQGFFSAPSYSPVERKQQALCLYFIRC